MNKIKVCVIGMGEFSDFFIPLFKNHPDVAEVSIADIIPERVAAAAKKHGISRTFSSLEDVLKNGKDVDSIALFTQRQAPRTDGHRRAESRKARLQRRSDGDKCR